MKKALNVPDDATWLECLPGAGRRRLGEAKQPPILLPGKTYLAQDRPVSVVPYVAELLDEAGIRVLIYNGDRDMTTNAQGSELLLDSMEWSGAAGWADTMRFERGLWFPMPTKFGGYVKQYRNLEFLVVSNSGHLVPFNVDEIALDLITRFLGNVTYLDKPVPKFNIARRHQSSSNHHTLREHHHRETQKKSNVGGFIGSFLFAAISFVMGFLVSRRMPKRRGNYEMIPCHADVNGTHECQSITNKARNDLA